MDTVDARRESVLVATRLPPGKLLYRAPGQTEDPKRLLAFARNLKDCPAGIEVAGAEDVGLEWHFDGEKAAWGDEYRKGRWVIIYPESTSVRKLRV